MPLLFIFCQTKVYLRAFAFDDDVVFCGVDVEPIFGVEVDGVIQGAAVGDFFVQVGIVGGDDHARFLVDQIDNNGHGVNRATCVVDNLPGERAAKVVKLIDIVGGGQVQQFGGGFPGPIGIDLDGVLGGGVH